MQTRTHVGMRAALAQVVWRMRRLPPDGKDLRLESGAAEAPALASIEAGGWARRAREHPQQPPRTARA